MMGVEPSKSEHEGQHAPMTLTHTFSRPAVARMFLRYFRYIRFHTDCFANCITQVQEHYFYSHTVIAIASNIGKFIMIIVICD